MAPNIIEKACNSLDNISEKSSTSFGLISPNSKSVENINSYTISGYSSKINLSSYNKMPKDEEKTKSLANGKMTLPLALGAGLALLTGSIPSGYNVGAVNTPQQVLIFFCNHTLTERGIIMSSETLGLLWSVCVSILLLGAIIATSFTNQLAIWAGRKGALLISGIIGITGSILFLASHYFRFVEILLLARFVSGIHSGLTSGLVPLYIAEISPEKLKGSMGVLHNFGLNFGMLIAQLLGQQNLLGTESSWSFLLSLSSGFILIGLTIYLPSPSSPLYLYVIKGKHKKAATALAYLRRSSLSRMEEEISLLRTEQKKQEANKSGWTFISLLISPEYRKLVYLILLLHIGQQFSGINAVFYYSTATFADLGMTMEQAQYGSIAAVFVNTITCLISIPFLKKCRRRSLLFLSLWGGLICLIGLTITTKIKDSFSWAPIATIIFFLAFVCIFAMGNGSIPWLIPSELLPQSTLGAAMGLGGLTNWIGNFSVALFFPIANNFLSDSVFLIFVAFGIFEGIVIYFYLPETSPMVKKTSKTEVIYLSRSTTATINSPSTSSNHSPSDFNDKNKTTTTGLEVDQILRGIDDNLAHNRSDQIPYNG